MVERNTRRSDAERQARPDAVSRQLYLVAALMLAIIVGGAVHQLWLEHDAAIDDTERQLARLDMVFAEQTGRTVETVDLLLRDAVETVRASRGEPLDERALSALLRRRVDGVPQISEILVADATGHVVASSLRHPGDVLPAPFAAQLARRAAAASPDLKFSEPFRKLDGTWSALMVRGIPASAANGIPSAALDGIVVACLNLSYFEDFYRSVDLPEKGIIKLQRRDGIVLARFPHNDVVIGASLGNMPQFRDVLATSSAGTALIQSPLNGTSRVLAIRALDRFPLAVSVSVDQNMILAPWLARARLLIGLALVAGAVVAALLILLAGRSRDMAVLVAEFRAARDSAEQANMQLRDEMTERERAEAALLQSQRIEVFGQLTGGVAHDFNNLLTVVLGNLDILEHGARLAPAHQTLLGVIRSAAERGAALTAQLLAFARRQPLVASVVDVGAVLGGMCDLLHSALGGHIRITTTVAPDLWQAMIDPTQVELLVLNLAINARDAMPDGGELSIAASNVELGRPTRPEQPPPGAYVKIVMSDTGTGMTPEVLARVFEPFFTTKAPGRGSGLGLSQVYGVVQQSGGGVLIDSEPGHGTSVTVLLPQAPCDQVAKKATALGGADTVHAAAPAVRHADGVVLLVDDDATVRATTATVLRRLGYGVAEADGGSKALAMLRSGLRPALVLTDIAMPDMNGTELERRLRRDWPDLPVVYITGYTDPESIADAELPRRLVRKPFRAAVLGAQLEAALAEHLARV